MAIQLIKVPAIERDGKISELEVYDSKPKAWARDKVVKTPEGRKLEKELFERVSFKFRPFEGNCTACVEIYIHSGYATEWKDKVRQMHIEKFVQDNAAWFFTYGERREHALVHASQG